MSLRPLVLLTALLLEDDYLLSPAVAYNSRIDSRVTAYLGACVALNAGNPDRLPIFDSELLTACSYNCVTHLYSP